MKLKQNNFDVNWEELRMLCGKTSHSFPQQIYQNQIIETEVINGEQTEHLSNETGMRLNR